MSDETPIGKMEVFEYDDYLAIEIDGLTVVDNTTSDFPDKESEQYIRELARRWNAFPALVTLLEKVLMDFRCDDRMCTHDDTCQRGCRTLREIRAALANATGGAA